jgi:integrase
MAAYSKTQRGGLRPDKYLSDEQFRKLMKYVRGAADLARMRGRKRAVFTEFVIELLAGTGLRASEVTNLNIADLPVTHGKRCIWVRDGKGRISRVVDVSERLCRLVNRFVRLYRKKAGPDAPLLVSERGKRLPYRCLHNSVSRAGERAGIGHLHPHMLRHTYLTRLYNVEQDLRFVQDQAGHTNPTTTTIYAKTDSKSRQRQLEAMDA